MTEAGTVVAILLLLKLLRQLVLQLVIIIINNVPIKYLHIVGYGRQCCESGSGVFLNQ